jgi:hypothetical protein
MRVFFTPDEWSTSELMLIEGMERYGITVFGSYRDAMKFAEGLSYSNKGINLWRGVGRGKIDPLPERLGTGDKLDFEKHWKGERILSSVVSSPTWPPGTLMYEYVMLREEIGFFTRVKEEK